MLASMRDRHLYHKKEYSGVAQLGIEALELKIKGYSGADMICSPYERQ